MNYIQSKYGPIIAVFLYENKKDEYCSHTELSNALKVSKTNLTNIMKRLEEAGLFEIEIEGRNKYYYLSESGVQFYNSLKEPMNKFYYQRAKFQLSLVSKTNKKKKIIASKK